MDEYGNPVEGASLNIKEYILAGALDHTKEISYFSDPTGLISMTLDQGAKVRFQSEDIPAFDVQGAPPIFTVPSCASSVMGRYITKIDVRLSGTGLPYGAGITVLEKGTEGAHKTILTFNNVILPMVDNAGVVAYASRKIYDFPAGAIRHFGSVSDIDLTKSSAGVNGDWDGDFSIGSVAANNGAALATTEQDIIPTTATPQAVSGVTTANGQSTTTEGAKIFDGTGTSIDAFFNILIDDADHDVTGTPCNLILNGTVTINWANLGDY